MPTMLVIHVFLNFPICVWILRKLRLASWHETQCVRVACGLMINFLGGEALSMLSTPGIIDSFVALEELIVVKEHSAHPALLVV